MPTLVSVEVPAAPSPAPDFALALRRLRELKRVLAHGYLDEEERDYGVRLLNDVEAEVRLAGGEAARG
jgi:hypothetical protein